ncbi:hypothetical protein Taro_015274 [Colocasia esculenta]|uniref:Uncharacterized protein n=1 Tax=Colocasia esculenta TaxID=4460 RepID=A0A843UH28_COLES|nr:hypothetical protein [Colocasia esculenta]
MFNSHPIDTYWTSNQVQIHGYNLRDELNDKVDCRLVIVGGIGVAVYPLLAAIDQAVYILCPSRIELCD